ncbi:MAG: hypothetical protein WC876_04755 [Candidatus Thermoplasmatota archaeon]|jgi:hypothetical protein
MAKDDASRQERATYAAGLLALLFAVNPFYANLKETALPLFGDEFNLGMGYVLFAVFLGLAVYCYALSYVSVLKMSSMKQAGDWMYIGAMLTPPTFIGLFTIAIVQNLLIPNPHDAELFGRGLASGLLIAMMLLAYFANKKLKQRDQQRKEKDGLQTAFDLASHGFHQQAVLEATNAMIGAAERKMGKRPLRPTIFEVYEWIKANVKIDVDDIGSRFEEIRIARNDAAHGRGTLSEESAQRLIELVSLVIDSLEGRSSPS